MTLWFLARSLGFVALLALTASTALGAWGSARGTLAPDEIDRRFLRQMAHRSAAITGLVALGLHILLIVLDSFVSVSIAGILVPFTAGWSPFAVGIGSLATYAIIAAAVSGAMRSRLASSGTATRRWRIVHLSAYVGWLLSIGHGLLAGTDTGQGWAWAIYGACVAVVATAVAVRLHRHAPSEAPMGVTQHHVGQST